MRRICKTEFYPIIFVYPKAPNLLMMRFEFFRAKRWMKWILFEDFCFGIGLSANHFGKFSIRSDERLRDENLHHKIIIYPDPVMNLFF